MLTSEFNALELGFNGDKLTAQHVTSKGINHLKTIRMDKDFGSPITTVSYDIDKVLYRVHIKVTNQLYV
jgi:hypothetical protein